ncbi:MAG: methyltransferase domain-containing protein [Myxococcota bacterium]
MSEACDLCAGSAFDPYVPHMYSLAGRPFDLVRCRACSLVQVRPLPDPSAVEAMYGDDYFDKDYDSCLHEESYFDSFPRLMERYGKLLDEIEREQAPGALFEVGCAGGWFLELARERGWKVRGVEITRVGADHARRVLGLDVERSTFPGDPLPGGPYDVVYMGHVLEHLRSPTRGVETAVAALRPGGLLVVEVPSYVDSAWFRALRRGLPGLRALGLDAGGLLRALKFPRPGETMEPFHLYEFRRRTLTRLLEGHGLRVLRTVSRVPKPDSLARSANPLLRAIGRGFDVLDAAALHWGLPGGNLAAFARRASPAAAP